MFPKGTHWVILYYRGKIFRWNEEKDLLLRETRGVSFEQIASLIQGGGLLDRRHHPNQEKYPHQKMFIVERKGYAYIVPYVESEYEIFLKTIVPSKKETKKYLGDKI